MRTALAASTRHALLIDETGAPIPRAPRTVEIDVRTLPVIAADALPALPKGIEARLYQDPDGENHVIVLWSPVYEVAVEITLAHHIADRTEIVRAADAMAASLPTRRRSSRRDQ